MGLFDSLFKSNSKKKKSTHRVLPKTVQESIPYTTVFKTKGTIETRPGSYTRAYNLEDINFKIAPDSDQVAIFRSYGDFLNTFSANVEFQVIIQNHSADRRASLEDIRFRLQSDGLNKYRQEMNGILLDKLTEGKKSLKQEKYLIVGIKDDDVEHAMVQLDNLDKEVEKSLHRISADVTVKPQSITERLEHLFNFYNQDGQSVFYNDMKDGKTPYFNYDKLLHAGLSSKDVIGPSGIEFKPNYFTMGETFGRAMYLENVPTWLSTDFISDLSDVPCNLVISIHHRPIETAKAMRMIKDHMTSVNAQIAEQQKNAARNGYTFDLISPDLALAQKQTRALMDDVIGRDQKLYHLTFTVCVFANSKDELEDNTKMINAISNKYMCPIKTLSFQQEQGLNSSLPLCLKEVAVDRLYTTESASIFIPYTSLELYQKEGNYYGLNQSSNNMILYSRLTGRNYNGLIFGESGAGKSFTAKCEMVSVLLRSDKNQVYVIDPEAEYIGLARALKGEIVDLTPGSQTYVNPLDMDIDYDGESDPVSMKMDYIVSMVEIMLGQGRSLDPQARSILGRCVNNIYKGYIDHMNQLKKQGSSITCDKAAMPTLNNLYNELKRQDSAVAQTLANIIEVYATGSFATFAHRSNVETDSSFVVYNIKNLGTGMKDLGLHVCLNDIWNKMIENRKKGIYTWIYIDEFYLLLQSDSAAKFLMQVWKRARKWWGVPTGIMQNTEDLLRSADSRNIINNTSFIMMLSLPKLDRTNLGDLLQIPDSQLTYIANAQPGHGLIYTGKTVLPFDDTFPTDTELYRLMNTKNNDETRIERGFVDTPE